MIIFTCYQQNHNLNITWLHQASYLYTYIQIYARYKLKFALLMASYLLFACVINLFKLWLCFIVWQFSCINQHHLIRRSMSYFMCFGNYFCTQDITHRNKVKGKYCTNHNNDTRVTMPWFMLCSGLWHTVQCMHRHMQKSHMRGERERPSR